MAGTNNSWNNQIAGSYNQIILNAGTNGVAISTDASAATVNVATGGAVKTSTFGSTNSTSATTVQSGSGALNVTSTNGALTIDSGTGALAISNDASATTVTVATGAAVKTATFGSTNSTSTTTVQSGTGALNVTSTNGALTINSGTGALGVSTDASATTLSIGTGGAVKTVTVGSTNSTSVTTIACGTGGANFGTSANAHATIVGSTTAASTTTIQAPSAGVILTGVQGVAVSNKNYVTINTSTGAIGSDAGPTAGALVLLATTVAASTATITFNSSLITTTYLDYLVTITGVTAGTNGVTLNMDWSTDNGSTYLNSNYACSVNTAAFNSAAYANQNSTTTIPLTNSTNVSATAITSVIVWIQGLGVATNPTYNGTGSYNGNQTGILAGANSGTPTVNNIKFTMSSGNIATGTFSLYGIAK